MMLFFRRLSPFLRVLFLIIVIEALSFAVVFYPLVNGVVAVVLSLIVFALTIVRPEIGLTIFASELFIGSKGGLFRLRADTQNNGGVSIRELLFVSVFLGWLVWSVRETTWRVWHTYLSKRWIYLGLLMLLVVAFLRGMWFREPFVFADANAWGILALLLPVLDVVTHRGDRFPRYLLPAMQAALFWLALKTLVLFYFFSHAFPPAWQETVYLWIRRTGVGEITRASGTAFRIFIQSQIYAIGVIVFLWVKRVFIPRYTRVEWAFLVFALAEVLISLSRSFWLGCGAAVVAILAWMVFSHRSAWKDLLQTMIVSGVGAILLTAGLLWLPLPPSDASLSSLLKTRISTDEDAAASRWHLLPLLWQGIERHPVFGSGFGATITYESRDPRIVQTTGGKVTTFAFEWGWLDLWYKFGMVILPLLGILLWRIGRSSQRIKAPEIGVAVSIGLLALTVTHFFTPYLNHPLGIGLILALEGGLLWMKIAGKTVV